MLREKAGKYYLENGKNCSEALLLAANEVYELNLKEEDIKLVSGFGTGLGCGHVCGALLGNLSVLGKVYGKTDGDAKDAFKANCAKMVSSFESKLGGSNCTQLAAKYKKEDGTRCVEAIYLAADVLEEHINALRGIKKETTGKVTVSAEDIKRVKAFGFLHNKGTDNFAARVITRNGKITNAESQCITEAANKYGNGEIAMTTRLTLEVQGVPYDNIEPFRAYLAQAGLVTGGTGSKVRPVVSCKGTTCQYGLYDTFDLSNKIHERFFNGYANVKLPHKFKIATGGCPNNCVKPSLNDFGIIGQRVPQFNVDACRGCKICGVENVCPIKVAKVVDGKLKIDTDQCNHCGRCIDKCHFDAMEGGMYGYKVAIGGRWGKKVAHGQELNRIFTTEEEVLSVLEKAILLFREQGITGERFADTINRLGFENVEKQLLGDEILERKDEIIGATMHTVGGATC